MRKFLKYFFRTVISLAVIFIMAYLVAMFTGHQYLLKGIYSTYLRGEKSATIYDAEFFDTREVKANNPKSLPVSSRFQQVSLSAELEKVLEESQTEGFVILKNDSILLKKYYSDYDDTKRTNSFSMAKTITVLLAQAAIQDGFLKYWDQPVKYWLPKLGGAYADSLKLKHLATMTAGLNWREHYTDAFSVTARTYYGDDVEAVMMDYVEVDEMPGEKFEYQSGATQLLGLVVSKAVGKSLAEYASEKFWTPMNAQVDAHWHVDRQGGSELAYCCFNAHVEDFARFGILALNNGKWNGEPLIDASFMRQATRSAFDENYGWGYWIYHHADERVFYHRGILGQYIIVFPERKVVVARIGHKNFEKIGKHHKDFIAIVNEIIAMNL